MPRWKNTWTHLSSDTPAECMCDWPLPVAAHLEPEILVVDEVLAVGDAAFQKKCLGKMGAVRAEGRTVIFVSHNMAAVNRLCKRCALLTSGSLSCFSKTSEVINKYISEAFDKNHDENSRNMIKKDPVLSVIEFISCDEFGRPKTAYRTSEEVLFRLIVEIYDAVSGLRIGIDFMDVSDGELLFRSFDDDFEEIEREKGVTEFICSIPANLLQPRVYKAIVKIGIHTIRWISDGEISKKIEVEHVDGVNARYAGRRPGRIMPLIKWQIVKK